MRPVPQDAIFTAQLSPHRSLSRRGLRRLILGIATLSALTATLFWWLGAWPVAGFSGAEILAAILLIRHHAGSAREAERIVLGLDMLEIIRTDRAGRQTRRRMSTAWLNLDLRPRPNRMPALLLVRHGCAEEIGAGLNEPDKRDLARALADALHRQRHPRFDNPQLG